MTTKQYTYGGIALAVLILLYFLLRKKKTMNEEINAEEAEITRNRNSGIFDDVFLKAGDGHANGKNEEVEKLQIYLNAALMESESRRKALVVDGEYGPKTAAAVREIFKQGYVTKPNFDSIPN